MAEQDFNINIRVNADTAQVEAIRNSFEKLGAQVKVTNAEAAAGGAGGLGAGGGLGSIAGIGTIISSLTLAINKWREFDAEQDRVVEGMIKSEEKMRALGESIIDTQDKMISVRRTATEPLEQSFERLQLEIIKLQTEQNLLDLPSQGEEWKKLNAEIAFNESQLQKVTAAMEKQKEAAAKKDKELTDKTAKYVEGADPQVKAILANEKAMFEARAGGRDQDAAMFERTALGLRGSARPDQLEDVSKIYSSKEVVDALKEIGRSQREQIDLWK